MEHWQKWELDEKHITSEVMPLNDKNVHSRYLNVGKVRQDYEYIREHNKR